MTAGTRDTPVTADPKTANVSVLRPSGEPQTAVPVAGDTRTTRTVRPPPATPRVLRRGRAAATAASVSAGRTTGENSARSARLATSTSRTVVRPGWGRHGRKVSVWFYRNRNNSLEVKIILFRLSEWLEGLWR